MITPRTREHLGVELSTRHHDKDGKVTMSGLCKMSGLGKIGRNKDNVTFDTIIN